MSRSEPPVLVGPRVRLRPFVTADVEGRQALGEDAEIVRLFGGSPDWEGVAAVSAADAREWYDGVAGQPHHWAVEVAGRFLGTARLHSLDDHDRRARYAVGLLDPALLGRGLGTEVTRLVLDHAFGTLHLHRVDLRVLATNARAIACYRRCGFVEEGRERESALVDGTWIDDVVMGVLEHEHASTP